MAVISRINRFISLRKLLQCFSIQEKPIAQTENEGINKGCFKRNSLVYSYM